MQECSNGHVEIVYPDRIGRTALQCPLCQALAEIQERDEEIGALNRELERLRDCVKREDKED